MLFNKLQSCRKPRVAHCCARPIPSTRGVNIRTLSHLPTDHQTRQPHHLSMTNPYLQECYPFHPSPPYHFQPHRLPFSLVQLRPAPSVFTGQETRTLTSDPSIPSYYLLVPLKTGSNCRSPAFDHACHTHARHQLKLIHAPRNTLLTP